MSILTPHSRRLLLLAALFLGLVALAAPAAAEPGSVAGILAEVQRKEAEVARSRVQLLGEEREAAREAVEIEQIKSQPPGLARDLDLQRRLAAAQERAERLSQKAAQKRLLDGQLGALRQRLMRSCDQVLGDGSTQLGAAQRIELLRLRAAQAEALSAVSPQGALPAALRAAAGDEPADDPQLLHERADLLRDSADKVRRELARIESRSEELQRRRRLRERAASVDEDLFAEQATSRRGTATDKARGTTDAAAEAAPGAFTGGPRVGDAPPQSPGITPQPTRSGLDPSTLDLLRRGDTSADPEVKLQALRRAQVELARMAAELARRAALLDRRAEELRRRK